MSVHAAIEDFRERCLTSLRRAVYLGIAASIAVGAALDPLVGASLALGVAAGAFARQLAINELAARARLDVAAAVKSARRSRLGRLAIYGALFTAVATLPALNIAAAACGALLPSLLLVLLGIVRL